MKKIRFLLEYHCSPVWEYDDNNSLIDNGLPDDLLEDTELATLLESISDEYDSLFINNSVEFSYKGFSNSDDEKMFDEKIRKAIALLKESAEGKYTIEIADSTFE